MKSYFNLDDLQNECIDFMNNRNVSSIYINKWKDFSLNKNEDVDDFESIESLILREIIEEGKITFYLKDNIDIKPIVKKELYKILCTDSKEYSEEKNIINQLKDNLIPVTSTALASKLGQDIAMITGIVSIVICGFFKFGKNVWCNCYKEQFESES